MEKKITNWVEKGYIDSNTAEILLQDVKQDKEKRKKAKINIMLYTVATVFLGIGVITFIASNDWIIQLLNSSDFIKIFLMSIITFGCFWGGYKLAYENKTFPKLGHTLFFLSSLLIGGLYALIGQTFNINANNPGLMFVWLVSIVPLAYLFKNIAINTVSIILFVLGIIFYYAQLPIDDACVWIIFIPAMLGIMLYTIGNIQVIKEKYNKFSIQYKIAGTMPIFYTLLVLSCLEDLSYEINSMFCIIPLVLLMILNFIIYICDKNKKTILKLETTFIILLMFFLLILSCATNINPVLVIILANTALISIISFGLNYGYKFENEKIITHANRMLMIYILVDYCRWCWNLLNTALFFTLGGIVLLVLGLYLEKNKTKAVLKEKQ